MNSIKTACCLAAALLSKDVAPAPVRLAYRVECIADGVDDRLLVDLRVAGLDPAQRDLAFELPRWGEWIELDEYYVRRVSGSPPVVHDLDNRFYWRPQLPAAWDGTLAIHYELPIVAVRSVAHESHGLLPWRSGDYVNGYSINTLMRLLVGDARQDSARTLELVAPEGWSVASGWGGVAQRTMVLPIPADGDNSALLFGRVVERAVTVPALVSTISVTQFTTGPDRTVAVRDLLVKLRAAYAATTGSSPPSAENVFLLEPGMGGTHTEGAISMGWPELGDDGRFDVGTAHFIAHESFHAWLPGVLRPVEGADGDGLEWFFEGSTDYFSLWHLASVGAITAQQFADQLRLIELIGKGSPAWGEVAFADRAIGWRVPDNEVVAYRGGALLAFHLDVELRLAGRPGLLQLFRDFAAEHGSRYDLAKLEAWSRANGLADAWQRNVASPERADAADDLVRIGAKERREGDSRIVTASGADLGDFFEFAAR